MAWQDLLATGFQSGGWQVPALIDSLSARASAAGKDGFDWGPAIEKLLHSNGATYGTRAMWTEGSPAPSILDDILAAANGHNLAPWSDNPSAVNPNLLRTDPAEKAAAIASMQQDQSDNGSDGLGDLGTLAMLAAAIYGGGSLAGLWGSGAGAAGAGLEAAGAFGGEAFGAAANSAGAFGGSIGPWTAGIGAATGATGGGMDWWGTDYMGDYGFPDVNVNTMMPPAVPETVDTLKSWGLTETSPGVWAQPAMPSLQMGPADWLKLGSQAVSGLGSLAGGAAPNVNTMGGLGNLASMFGSTGGLLGAGLGGLAGMLNGTKKIDDAVTTESGYNSTLSPAAEAEMLKTIRGDYLNPDSNPWLKSTFDRSAGEIQSKLSPSFGHMEAFGQNSGFQNAYGRSLADLSTSLYGGNYNNERTRQFGAASAAPNYTKKSTTPVYSNPLGGMFSGAMAGGLLGGKLFGG